MKLLLLSLLHTIFLIFELLCGHINISHPLLSTNSLQYDDTKKVTNVSLYIVGEYDILNDLCLDGGPRLKNSQNLSDLELLLQNDPCPPPNRWVRKTGWGKCNPSSMYAECPPEGFDLVGYGKRDGPVRVNPVPRPVMEVKS